MLVLRPYRAPGLKIWAGGVKLSIKRIGPELRQSGVEARKEIEVPVKIVWKGKRISKLVFAGGKTVEFEVA